MTEPTIYEIELKGKLGVRSLRPLMDDFSLAESEVGVTRLVGVIRDASHMHGLVVHLASMNVDIISIAPRRSGHPRTTVMPAITDATVD